MRFSSAGLKIIDRHILREWMSILLLVVVAMLGLLLIQAMMEDFRDLLSMGAATIDIVIYFMIKVPSFLAIVLPVILLISLLYALGQLHRTNEILAMRAAGLGVFRITRSIWCAGVLMCGLMWVLNASVVPWSVERSRALLEQIGFSHEEKEVREAESVGVSRVVTFDNEREGRMWFINRYSRFTRRAYGVTVSEFTLNRQEKLRIFAREGRYDSELGYWIFRDGRESWLDPETGDVTSMKPFAEKVMKYYTEDPALMLVFDLKPTDLSFFELRRIIDYFNVQENPKVTIYAVRYYGLLADTLTPLIVILIAIPFAMTGVRTNPVVGVAKSLGLFALYFILLQIGGTLGNRGVLDPMIAAAVPGAAMLFLGGWFFARMR